MFFSTFSQTSSYLILELLDEIGSLVLEVEGITDTFFTSYRDWDGKISFKCKDGNLIREAVGRAKESGEGVTFETNSVGYDESNSIVAQFKITWSVKKKSAG